MKKIFLSVAFLATTGLIAHAQIGSQILNSQINLDNNWSNLHASVGTIGGDVVVQGAAGGNLVDITTMNDTRVLNSQIVGPNASIGSNITLGANNVWGSVGIQNQVLCNGASVSTDPILTSVKSTQECHAADPYSQINANVVNIAGDMVVQSSALGNSFEADSNAPNMPIMTRQINTSASVSNTTVGAANVGDSIGITSSAIGNTAQIIHYGTP
jgi:hypothetical protein